LFGSAHIEQTQKVASASVTQNEREQRTTKLERTQVSLQNAAPSDNANAKAAPIAGKPINTRRKSEFIAEIKLRPAWKVALIEVGP
jgi:hypothetical protein